MVRVDFFFATGAGMAVVEFGPAKVRPPMMAPNRQGRLLLITDLPLVSRTVRRQQPPNYHARGLAIDGYQNESEAIS